MMGRKIYRRKKIEKKIRIFPYFFMAASGVQAERAVVFSKRGIRRNRCVTARAPVRTGPRLSHAIAAR